MRVGEKMTKKVVVLGEILLRLSPIGRNRIIGSKYLEVNVGGSETNVAVALSNYGIEAYLVSKLPENELGDTAIREIKAFGVDTSNIIRGGDRIGIYFLENGHSIRPSKVIYDRKNSSIASAKIEEYDIDKIFEEKDLFHVSGITLAISEDAFELAKELMKTAKDKGIKVSFDFNYRSKLWSIEQAKEKFNQILKYVDILIGNHLDFTHILDIKSEKDLKNTDIKSYYDDLYSKVYNKYGFEYIVSSMRKVDSASQNTYQGFMYHRNKTYTSKKYHLEIVDRVGTGDAFAAGFLYSYLTGKDNNYIIEFSAASAALKHTIPGDLTIANVVEIEQLFNSCSFAVQR
jgi:2-dehydro-3-deoxygluconokinase